MLRPFWGSECPAHNHMIVTALGKLASTPGGIQERVSDAIHATGITTPCGRTVEWHSSDVTGHTITFGQEPPDVTPQTPRRQRICGSRWRAPRHHQLNHMTASLRFIAQAAHERTGVARRLRRHPISLDLHASRKHTLHMRLSRPTRHEGRGDRPAVTRAKKEEGRSPLYNLHWLGKVRVCIAKRVVHLRNQ